MNKAEALLSESNALAVVKERYALLLAYFSSNPENGAPRGRPIAAPAAGSAPAGVTPGQLQSNSLGRRLLLAAFLPIDDPSSLKCQAELVELAKDMVKCGSAEALEQWCELLELQRFHWNAVCFATSLPADSH